MGLRTLVGLRKLVECVSAPWRGDGPLLATIGSISKVRVLDQPAVRAAALAHGKTAAQVALKWCVQQRIAAVTSTSNPKHVLEALDLASFTLTRRQMRALTAAQ